MFRIIFFFIDPAPHWMAYLQWAVMIVLMGATYIQVTRRRMGFMAMFGVMIGIFMVDIFAYLPFYAYLVHRDRKRAAAAEI